MAFESGRKIGNLWKDMHEINKTILNFSFNLSNKTERQFENSFSSVLCNKQSIFNNEIITQINKKAVVQSVYCFGKNNRPDMTINNDGIAIEIKYIDKNLDGLKQSIGQGYLYRLRYKFVVIILIISSKNKELFGKIVNGEEKDLEDILKHLADKQNIFTYLVPAFTLKKGQKKYFTSFES